MMWTPNAMLMQRVYVERVMLLRFRRHSEELWLHVNLAEPGDAAGQLEEGLDAFQNTHVREANLLDKLQLRMLAEGIDRFGDSEHCADDVVTGVA